MSNRVTRLVHVAAIAGIAFAGSADRIFAQGPPPPAPGAPGGMGMRMVFPGGPDIVGFAGPGPFEPPVEGLPYIADVTTEFRQDFADGNRVEHRSTATVARDSQGRTRREQTIGPPPGAATSGEPHQMILINDPVAKVAYSLDPAKQTAMKLTMPERPEAMRRRTGRPDGPRPEGQGPDGAGAATETWNRPVPPPDGPGGPPHGDGTTGPSPEGSFGGGNVLFQRRPGAKPEDESLGTKTINGIEAEGVRTTLTIPAGAMGNVKPIQIVTERWFAPSLKVVVYSRHSDPRSGETIYQLSNIRREEPGADLFAVPDGYTVTTAPKPFMRWRSKE